jgi:DNA-binding response OmpR family regulator
MRVLIVEDEASVSQFIRQGLTEAGYAVDSARDGEEGLEYLSMAEYDAVVLDIMLPKLSGLELLRRIRNKRIKTPVLILTARDGVEDRVRGLDAGADDYLVKPFAFSELLARIRALMRRPPLQIDTVLQVGDLELDTAHHEVRRADRRVDLSAKEFALLEFLMRRQGQVLTRTQIVQHVWNYDFCTYIGYLRRKIDTGFAHPLIQTVRGVGYRLGSKRGDP